MKYWIVILCLMLVMNGFGQETETSPPNSPRMAVAYSIEDIPSGSLEYVEKKYARISKDIQRQSEKLLTRIQEQEAKLQKQLSKTDNIKTKELFEIGKEKYELFQNKIQSPVNKATEKLKEYIPGLDSTNTVLKFLSQSQNISQLGSEKLDELSSVTDKAEELQGRIQQANEIEAFIKERESMLKEVLANTEVVKELLGFNKEVFYYQQKLKEYKELIKDRKKLEKKLINTISTLPAFQKFWQKNSYLAQLFRLPGDPSDGSQLVGGLQTREQLQEMTQRLVTPGQNPQQFVQQQVQSAQAELDKLKDKLNQLGGGGSSDMTMPDFKPNQQKTKTFFERLEYGFDLQNQRGSFLLPAISDLGLSLGYKIDDKKTVGLGISYKLGWGHGWDNIKFTSEGIGLRSYADLKFKGSFWFSSGLEYNYMQSFNNFSQIKNLNIWQKSGLVGVTKKYKVGKRTGKIQVLWDFMSYYSVPRGQPIKFRIGTQL